AGMNNYSDENLFFNSCYWVYNLKTAAQIARIIGRETDAEIWSEKAKLASEAIHNKYYIEEEKNYSDMSMRSLTAALYGAIMPEELRLEITKSVKTEILIKQNGPIDVGTTGGAMLIKVLREAGRDVVIYSMTSKTTYPGWGIMKEN